MVSAAAAASAASSASNAGPLRHRPPYKEMIVRAIECLKENNGSSRAKISKFIAIRYFGLPPEHEALVSNHIRGLKKDGVITDIKRLYMMAGDSSGAPKRRVAAGGSSKGMVVAPKRGRPLKPGTSGGRRGRPFKSGDPAVARRSGRLPKVPNSSMLDPASIFAKQKQGQPTSDSHLVSRDAERSMGNSKSGQQAKIVPPVFGDVKGLVGRKKRGRPSKVLQPGPGMMNETLNTKQKLRTSQRLLLRGSGSNVVAAETVTGKRKSSQAQNIVKPEGAEEESIGKRKRVSVDGKREVIGSLGQKTPEPPIKVGKRKTVHLDSGGTEGFMGRKKPGRPAKIVQPDLSTMNDAGENFTAKKKLRTSQRLLLLGFGSKNVATEAVIRKRESRTFLED